MQKKLFGILLALCMLLSLCFAISATEGEVTHVTEVPEGYTGISDEADLQTLMNDEGLSGNYILMGDITLTAATTQSPIGTADVPFTGTFDGNNYTISGIDITGVSGTNATAALFGGANGATFKNLTISGKITGKSSYAAALIAQSTGSVTIEKVTSNVTVTNGTYAGDAAFIGYAALTEENAEIVIRNCVNDGAITGSRWVGGFIGYLSGTAAKTTVTIEDCKNNGTITSKNSSNGQAGGIIGYVYAMATTGDYTAGDTYSVSKLTLTRCKNTGDVSATASQVGGMIGAFLYLREKCYVELSMTELYNSGTITGKSYAGAIFGIHRPAMKPADGVLKYTLKDWMNVGTVSAIIGGIGTGENSIWGVSNIYDAVEATMIGTDGGSNNFTSTNVLSGTVTGETGSTFVQAANAGETKAWGYSDKQSTPTLTFVTNCVHIWETTETTHTCDCGKTGEHAMTDGMCTVCAYSACTHEGATVTATTTAATCLNVGWGTYTCGTCGNTFEAEIAIDANNHEGEIIYIGTATGGMKTYDCHDTVEVESYSISEDKVIDTANEILALMLTEDATVLGGTYTVSGTIDLSGLPVQDPIGDKDHPFTGSIDGGTYDEEGKVAATASITGIAINGGGYSALIGATGTSATIKNLTVTGTVQASTTYAAGLVAQAYGSLTITNVTSNLNVTCAAGVVSGFLAYASMDTAGSVIAISDSQNNGTVTGTRYMGGFVGSLVGAGAYCELTITNCVNNGNIVGNSAEANYNGYGGMIGYFAPTYKNVTEGYTYGDDAFALSITKCANYGNISNAQAKSYAAGIIGTLNLTADVAHMTADLSDLYNAGTMSANYNGAIVGIIRTSILNSESAAPYTLKNWKNDVADLNMIGYVGSYATKWTLENVYNAGAATLIKGTSAVSGTVTYQKAAITFTNCFVKDGDADAFAVGAAASKAWMYDAAQAPMLAFMAAKGTECTHDYIAVDDGSTHICICGVTGAHEPTESTCTICGYNPCTHENKTLTSTITEATCTTAGLGVYTCDACGATMEEPIAINPDNHIGTEYLSTTTGAKKVYSCHNDIVIKEYVVEGPSIDSVDEIVALMHTTDADLLAADYTLAQTLDLTGVDQAPIGPSKDNPFTGTFDGNGFSIIGLAITKSSQHAALFGVVGNKDINAKNNAASISNLTVEGTVTNTAYYAAGLVAEICGYTTIDKCVSNVSVTGTQRTGGLVGGLRYDDATGMVVTIKNSENKGNVKGTGRIAGIVGYVLSNSANPYGEYCGLEITKCVNSGDVTGTYEAIGGVVGIVTLNNKSDETNTYDYNDNDPDEFAFKITKCANYGTITSNTDSSTYPAGILSFIAGAETCDMVMTLTELYNGGAIRTQATDKSFGGIVGLLRTPVLNGTVCPIEMTNWVNNGRFYEGVIEATEATEGSAGTEVDYGMIGYFGDTAVGTYSLSNLYNMTGDVIVKKHGAVDAISGTSTKTVTLTGEYMTAEITNYLNKSSDAITAFGAATANENWMYDAAGVPMLAFMAEEGTVCNHAYGAVDTDTHTCICGASGEHDGKHTACTVCGYLCENTEAYVAVENGYACTVCGTVITEVPAAQVLYTVNALADNKLTVSVKGTGFGIAQLTVNLPEGFTLTGWETAYASSAGGWLVTGVDAVDGVYVTPYNFAMLNIPTAAEDGALECVDGDIDDAILTISYTAAAGATGEVTVTSCEAYTMEEVEVTSASVGAAITYTAAPVAGDVNKDGEFTVVDALLILKAILNEETLANADMNGDETLSLVDVMIVLKKI